MNSFEQDFNRRKFLNAVGKGFGMIALSSSVVASLFENLQAKTRLIERLSPAQVAADEDFRATVQQSFSVTRGIVNLNNGGVSPSPRMVTDSTHRLTTINRARLPISKSKASTRCRSAII